jgi:hypothetical protein
MSDIVSKTLYPKIEVYKGLLPEHKKIFEIIKSTEGLTEEDKDSGEHYFNPWYQWSAFGLYSSTKHKDAVEDQLGKNETFDNEYWAAETVFDAYNVALDHYIEKYNVDLPKDSELGSSSFCKYHTNVDTLKNNLTMQFHTDFKQTEKDMPGNQFFITCTVYINDDYEGGEIEFYVDGEFVPAYKPEAGDIMVFPSGEPYYHGVRTATQGNKYLIRNFMFYPYEGSEEWLANQSKYGAVKWAQMERRRMAEDVYGGNIVFKDGVRVMPSEQDIQYALEALEREEEAGYGNCNAKG